MLDRGARVAAADLALGLGVVLDAVHQVVRGVERHHADLRGAEGDAHELPHHARDGRPALVGLGAGAVLAQALAHVDGALVDHLFPGRVRADGVDHARRGALDRVELARRLALLDLLEEREARVDVDAEHLPLLLEDQEGAPLRELAEPRADERADGVGGLVVPEEVLRPHARHPLGRELHLVRGAAAVTRRDRDRRAEDGRDRLRRDLGGDPALADGLPREEGEAREVDGAPAGERAEELLHVDHRHRLVIGVVRVALLVVLGRPRVVRVEEGLGGGELHLVRVRRLAHVTLSTLSGETLL